ncbi:MAG: hypothetical protein H6846_07560 [Hyphomonas sp.]|nr:hypothetical protein [Hyphomonas sp.]MCB9961977.1 hypothetical protein [Hyphomonas sp.]
MRTIEVDIDVFAAIWKERSNSETSENQILRRLLVDNAPRSTSFTTPSCGVIEEEVNRSAAGVPFDLDQAIEEIGKVRWVDDVVFALRKLGGKASLHAIYTKVEERRMSAGRSVPRTLDATIRRTLEDHSSDSENFKGTDLFANVSRGVWALRKYS